MARLPRRFSAAVRFGFSFQDEKTFIRKLGSSRSSTSLVDAASSLCSVDLAALELLERGWVARFQEKVGCLAIDECYSLLYAALVSVGASLLDALRLPDDAVVVADSAAVSNAATVLGIIRSRFDMQVEGLNGEDVPETPHALAGR